MELRQIRSLQFLEAGFGAESVQAIAGLTEQAAAHGFECALKQMVPLLTEIGQLHLALTLKRLGGKSRAEQYVSQQFQAKIEIAAEDFGVEAVAVIAPVAIDAATNRLDLGGNVLGGARFG